MEDFLQLDNTLNEDEKLIRDTVKKYVDKDVVPHLENAFEQGIFPRDFIKQTASLGLLGLTLPEKYGGSGASATSYGLVCQELERGDSGLRSFVSVQSSLCMFPIYQFGSEEQKQRFLPKMAQGEIIGCFGLTEPDSGSDPSSMHTVAKKVPGGYRLSGSKMWITNSPISDIGIIWAKTEAGIRGFIVERDFDGVSTPEIKHKLSLRASVTGEFVMDDVFVPDENLLPGSTKGLSAPLLCLTQARFGIAFGAMGAAMACFDIVRDYVLERKQFNKPIGSFQLVQAELAEMFTEITKAQCLNYQLGRLKENNQLSHVMVSMGKRNSCYHALDITRRCRNLLGANGVSLEYHVMRHMNNLESVFTYEGTHNVHTLSLGRHITGINAFA